MNLSDLLPWDVPPDLFIIGVAALSAVFCVLLVYRTLLSRDPLGPRMATIEARRKALKADQAAPRHRQRREQGLGLMRKLVKRFNLLRSREAENAALRLARAGWRSHDAVVIYFFVKLCLPFIFGGLALFFLYVAEIIETTSGMRALYAIAAVVLGTYGPDLFVWNAADKRRKAIQKAVPDTLDLLVICAEAGQSLDGALNRIAEELGPASPEMAEEIALTAMELGVLPERRQALDNLNQRTDMASIRAIVNTLIQTEKYGTPLAQSLRVLSKEYRDERMMKAEEKAARLPATLTVPMILFILPPLFIVLIGPAIIRTLDVISR